MQSKETTVKIKKGLYIVATIAVILIIVGLIQRYLHFLSLEKEAHNNAIPTVELIHPKIAPPQKTLTLPANISAWYATPIYAQVSGYVKMWYKDIGARVKAGDLLAEIDTPGLDAQYQSARASYDVAKARYKLAVITSKRWRALQGTQAVSQQEVDVKSADADAQKAQVEAAFYNQEHFSALEAFKRIVAPFDGVVTSRKADVGDYVNAGRGDVNSRGDVSELFAVADVHAMRVFVSIPQDYSGLLASKPQAQLHVLQYPKKVFQAHFLTTAAAFDPVTRTVMTELVLDNKEGLLWPNSYATVTFIVPIDPNLLVIPEGAIIFRRDGTQIAHIVNNHVHLQNVVLGRNLGNDVEVLSGVGREDFIVNNPAAGLLDGQEVRVVPGTPGYNAPLKQTVPNQESHHLAQTSSKNAEK